MNTLTLTEIEVNSDITETYVIYGTGEIGRMLEKTLKEMNQNVECYVCSDGYKKEETIEKIPVLEISEYLKRKNRNIILLTVQEGAENILKNLNMEQVEVKQINSSKDVLKVYKYFYHKYFQEIGQILKDEYIYI